MRRLVPPFALLTVLAVACAAHSSGSQSSAASASTPSSSDSPTTPVLNWDNPFPEDVSADANTATTSPGTYGLNFRPTFPQFNARLKSTFVSAEGTIAFVFDFYGDARFSQDPRLLTEESFGGISEAGLLDMKDHPAGPSQDFTLHQVGDVTILLIAHNEIGRAMFVRDGVLYDLSGPAAPPNAVLDLATQLVNQLG